MLGIVLTAVMTAFEPHPWSVLELAVWPTVQLFDDRTDVYGLRISLGLGVSRSVTGLDLGLVNAAENVTGLEVGLVNLAFALWSNTTVTGVQVGLLNATRVLRGLQIGLYNETRDGYGLQIGVVNTGEDFHGVQLGLLNFNTKSPLSFFPFVNARF